MTPPSHIKPMLAKLGPLPNDWEEWGYEFKWDGIRAILYWDGRRIRIESRNLLDITFRYPELTTLGTWLGANAIIDGEIVAPDSKGRPSFSILQQRMLIGKKQITGPLPDVKISYYLFDILYLNDENLMGQSYEKRRGVLEGLNIGHPSCRVPPSFRGKGKIALSVAKRHGLEGIVCKRLESRYSADRRTGDWIKVKIVKSDEFIICGYKYVKGTSNRIGSLQMGIYDKNKNLRFVGGVGTGFSAADHKILLARLEAEKTTENPFKERIGNDVLFVNPRFVAQIQYRRWPEDGMLQQASYKGLRTDKSPEEIILRK